MMALSTDMGLGTALVTGPTSGIGRVASMSGLIGMDGGAAYGATKAALGSMTRSWAAEFSPQGVRVNTVAAGPVYSTPDKAPLIDQIAKTTLLGRGAQVDEIAEV